MESLLTAEERKEVISEAKEIFDVEDVIASIVLVEELKNSKKLIFFIINHICRVGCN